MFRIVFLCEDVSYIRLKIRFIYSYIRKIEDASFYFIRFINSAFDMFSMICINLVFSNTVDRAIRTYKIRVHDWLYSNRNNFELLDVVLKEVF